MAKPTIHNGRSKTLFNFFASKNKIFIILNSPKKVSNNFETFDCKKLLIMLNHTQNLSILLAFTYNY